MNVGALEAGETGFDAPVPLEWAGPVGRIQRTEREQPVRVGWVLEVHRRAMKSLDRLTTVHRPSLVLHSPPCPLARAEMSMVVPNRMCLVRDLRGGTSDPQQSWCSPLSTRGSPGFTVVEVKILQIAPALHGAKMQTTEGTHPVVVWALIEDDDGNRHVVGLAVGGKGDRALIPPDQGTFESYSQTG